MNVRVKMFLICLMGLCIGTVIYLFSRPDAYISIVILKILNLENTKAFLPIIISYYLPDFLWAISLCSGLFVIYPLDSRKGVVWGVVTFLYGFLWEALQLFSIVSGTADIIDVLLYLAAALTVVVINNYFKKREEK